MMDKKTDICAIILAAGLSTRMGGNPKALCVLGGKTFLQRVSETFEAAHIHTRFVVTGHGHAQVAEAAEEAGNIVVHNPGYRQGMFSSVQAGMERAAQLGCCAGCFLLPVDIPLVSTAVPSAMAAAWQNFPRPEEHILLPAYGGRTGHPPLIGSDHFLPVSRNRQAEGLRGYLAALLSGEQAPRLRQGLSFPGIRQDRVQCFCVQDQAVLFDIDTPDRLAAAENALEAIS